jgi:hypothetical protein
MFALKRDALDIKLRRRKNRIVRFRKDTKRLRFQTIFHPHCFLSQENIRILPKIYSWDPAHYAQTCKNILAV